MRPSKREGGGGGKDETDASQQEIEAIKVGG